MWRQMIPMASAAIVERKVQMACGLAQEVSPRVAGCSATCSVGSLTSRTETTKLEATCTGINAWCARDELLSQGAALALTLPRTAHAPQRTAAVAVAGLGAQGPSTSPFIW